MTTFGILFRLIIAALLLGSLGLAPALQEEESMQEPQTVLYPVAVLVGADKQVMVEEAPRLRSASQSFLNGTP